MAIENKNLITEVLGYLTKDDPTNTDPRYLVSGSQNVLINEARKVETRQGYELLGDANTATTAIESSFTYKTNRGDEWLLRGYDDELEFYAGTVDSIAFNDWYRLKASWTSVDFHFATYWDDTALMDLLLFVVGDDKIYDWTGAVTTLASATSNTITKNGTSTWAGEGFSTSGTRKVIINGTEYTYTGGESTTTLTGVTPDPSSEAVNSLIYQTVRTNDNQPADGTVNDIIAVLRNQVWVGSETSRRLYVSKVNDMTDYTYNDPREPGDGALLILDDVCQALLPLEEEMLISAGEDYWYTSEFEQITVSTTLAETLNIRRLKTGPKQAAFSRDMAITTGNAIAFVSKEPKLYLLGRLESLEDINLLDISDDIQPDFDAEDFTGGQILANKRRIYISSPVNDKLYIHQTTQEKNGTLRRFWQPPQILPLRRLSIYNGDIYGHSSGNPESYKLFTGEDDNDKSFRAVARYAYMAYNARMMYKVFNGHSTEGYISASTKLNRVLRYDYNGATQELTHEIDGSNESILSRAIIAGSLGDSSLGTTSLGGQAGSQSGVVTNKFRYIKNIVPQDFFELQVEYWSDAQDAKWSIISQGANATLSKNKPIRIKS